MENLFVIGKIVNTQGIKGEMRVIPQTDVTERFELLDKVYVDNRGVLKAFDIENVRYHKQFVLLKLKGIDDMTTAERYKESLVKIPSEMALPCEEDEYYIRDLYDMTVTDAEGKKIGILTDIIFTAANDVYVITPEEGKDILIPAIKDCILDVDVKNKTMKVFIPEGLI